jgi:hypothetical protein
MGKVIPGDLMRKKIPLLLDICFLLLVKNYTMDELKNVTGNQLFR